MQDSNGFLLSAPKTAPTAENSGLEGAGGVRDWKPNPVIGLTSPLPIGMEGIPALSDTYEFYRRMIQYGEEFIGE